MPKDDQLSLDILRRTVKYLFTLDQQIQRAEDKLASELGVNPSFDVVMIPLSWMKTQDRYLRLPRWMKAIPTDQAYIIRDVCKPFKQKEQI